MVSRLCWLSYQQDNQQQPSNVLEYRVLQLDPSVRLRTLLAWIIFSQAAEPYFGAAALEFCDHSEGSCSRGVGAPVCIVGVLSTFQEILVSMVVWLLIQDPCTIHHYAGAQFPKPEGLINWWAVFDTLSCLASKILLVVESDLPRFSIDL